MVDINYTYNGQTKGATLYPTDLTEKALKKLTDEGFIDSNSSVFGITELYIENQEAM